MTNEKVNLTLELMVIVSKFSNFPNELSKNDEFREYELSGSDCTGVVYDRFHWSRFLPMPVNFG